MNGDKFLEGDLLKLSEHWWEHVLGETRGRNRDSRYIFVSYGQSEEHITVRKIGNKWPESFHHSFFEITNYVPRPIDVDLDAIHILGLMEVANRCC